MFQAAKRRARGFTRLSTIKTVISLIAGKLDFQAVNPHARQPTRNSTEPIQKTTVSLSCLTMFVGLTPYSSSRPQP